jgi:hypothetical protein
MILPKNVTISTNYHRVSMIWSQSHFVYPILSKCCHFREITRNTVQIDHMDNFSSNIFESTSLLFRKSGQIMLPVLIRDWMRQHQYLHDVSAWDLLWFWPWEVGHGLTIWFSAVKLIKYVQQNTEIFLWYLGKTWVSWLKFSLPILMH